MLLLLIAPLSDGFGFFVRPKATTTTGPHDYRRTNLSLDIGDRFHVKPGYQVRSSASTTDSKSYSLRMAYDANEWGLGLDGGFSPDHRGYKNQYLGADGWRSFTLVGQDRANEDDQIRLELGAGATFTQHHDSFQAIASSSALSGASLRQLDRGRGGGGGGGGDDTTPVAERIGGGIDINQIDLTGSIGIGFYRYLFLGLEGTRSSYDKDLKSINVRSFENFGVNDVASLLGSYPKSNQKATMELLFIPQLTPFIEVSKIQFELNAPEASSVVVGARVSIHSLRISLSRESYDPGGGRSKENYTSLGFGVRL